MFFLRLSLITFQAGVPARQHPSGTDTIVVSDQSPCATCKVKWHKVVLLGDSDPPEIEIPALSVGRLKSGRYLATGIANPGSLSLFDRDGQYLRAVGRTGHGPGEYTRPSRVVPGLGDSVLILDAGNRRLSILSPLGSYVRSISTAQVGPSAIVELPNQDFLVAGKAFTKDGAGYGIHVLSRNNAGARPIGEPLESYDVRHEADIWRVITVGRDSLIWTAAINRYAIEQRTKAGALMRVLSRRVDWFPAWEGDPRPLGMPPRPLIIRIVLDTESRLWVFIAIPSSGFKPILPGPFLQGTKHGERVPAPLLDEFQNYDTLIEILDPRIGRLLTSTRVPGYLFPAEPFPLALHLVRRQDGFDVPEIVRLSLDSAAPIQHRP